MGFFTSSNENKNENCNNSSEQTAPPPVPIEKIYYKSSGGGTYRRREAILNTLGTADLDFLLQSYAPDHVAKIDDMNWRIKDLQQGMCKLVPHIYSGFDKILAEIKDLKDQNKILQEKVDALEKPRTSSYTK